jgi:hypothetical protein
VPKGVWVRRGNVAVPADTRSLEFLQARKDGSEFIADTSGARNPKHLRLWWSLCHLVAETDSHYDTPNKVHKGLKRALHMVDAFLDRDGKLHIEEQSIAFESMDQETFGRHLKDAINVVAGWLGNAPEEVQKRFDEIVSDKRYEGYMR